MANILNWSGYQVHGPGVSSIFTQAPKMYSNLTIDFNNNQLIINTANVTLTGGTFGFPLRLLVGVDNGTPQTVWNKINVAAASGGGWPGTSYAPMTISVPNGSTKVNIYLASGCACDPDCPDPYGVDGCENLHPNRLIHSISLPEQKITVKVVSNGCSKVFIDGAEVSEKKINVGDSVTIKAEALPGGGTFTNWTTSEGDTLSYITETKKPTKDITYTANCAPPPDTVTITVAGNCSSVSVDGSGTSKTVNKGSSVTIKAEPVDGGTFTKWDDGDENSTRTIIANETKTYTATCEGAPEQPEEPPPEPKPCDTSDCWIGPGLISGTIASHIDACPETLDVIEGAFR